MNSLSERIPKNDLLHAAAVSARTVNDSETNCGSLVAELERSLRSSQGMLLHREIERLEKETDHQRSLLDEISAHLPRNGSRANLSSPLSSSDLKYDLRTSARRVLQLGRVHESLLNRMQLLLNVSCNCVAGSGAIYRSGSESTHAATSRPIPLIEA
jgi:hypothetical protein